MNRKRSVLNIFTDVLGKAITLIIGIVLPKLYIDSFGSEINGLISSINNLLIYINLIEAGVGGASTQALYRVIGEKDQKSINSILAATDQFYKRTGIYFFSIICITAFLYPVYVKSEISFGTVVILILLSAVPSAIKYFFQGKYTILLNADNRAYILNTVTLVFNIITNISKIVLLIIGCNVVIVQASYAVISILQMVVIVIYIKKRYSGLNLSVQPDVQAISKKKYVMVHAISSTIFSNIDILILTLFLDLKIVSVYTIYNMVFNNINQIIKSVSNGMNAFMGQLYYIDYKEFETEYVSFSVLYRYMALTLLTITGVMILPFMTIYASSFRDINYIDYRLPILFLSTNILDAIRWPEVLSINTTGHFQETAKPAIIETILNLLCSILLVSRLGIYGVLLGTIIALLYRTVDMIRYVNKNIVTRGEIKDIMFVGLSWIFSLLILWISYKVPFKVNNYWELIWQAILVAVVCGVLYFMISFLFYSKEYKMIYMKIKERVF